VAQPGQVVEVASGSYPYQRLQFDASKSSSADVVFEPAAGAAVSVAQIDFGQAQFGVPAAQHVTVRDLAVGYLRAWDGTKDVTWRNIKGRTFDVFSGSGSTFPTTSDVSVIGGNFGPCQAPRDEACTVRLVGTNIVVDGVSIHDVTSTDLVDNHVDGMFIRGGNDVVVRNSKFWNNDITNIRLQNCCDLPANRNVTLENNWFGKPFEDASLSASRGDGIDIDNPIPNLVIRNNSFAPGVGPQFSLDDYGGSGTVVANNLMTNLYQSCRPGITFTHNVVVARPDSGAPRRCGSSDLNVLGFGYVDAEDFDLHIAAGSPGIRHGDLGYCPKRDIDGGSREPLGGCDVGADQLRDTVVCRRGNGSKRPRTQWVTRRWLRDHHRAVLHQGACS